MKGSIVAAGEGDRLAARRARDIGTLLLASELDGKPGPAHRAAYLEDATDSSRSRDGTKKRAPVTARLKSSNRS